METGKRIRELRQARGMSQEDLGKIVGVRRAAVKPIFRGGGKVKGPAKAGLVLLCMVETRRFELPTS